MRSLVALRLGFALLLVATIAWKLSIKADPPSYAEQSLRNFLGREKFEVAETDQTMDNLPVLRAKSGACEMQVMKASYYGADRDSIRGLLGPGDTQFFVYRGRVYADQPIWMIVSDQIVMRLFRRLGLVDHEPPVIAVVAASACAADRLPWDQL